MYRVANSMGLRSKFAQMHVRWRLANLAMMCLAGLGVDNRGLGSEGFGRG
jgi:hypothetical protein